MEKFSQNRSYRLLHIYESLNKGEILNKTALSDTYNVSPKTVQRDINDIRAYIANTRHGDLNVGVVYDRSNKGYKLKL